MVSQVLETARLRVNKSNLEVLVGAAGPGARRINAEIARGAYQFTYRGEPIRATTVVRYLGCQVESQGNTRAEAQMMVIKASKAQTRYSCGLWAPRSIGLTTKIRLWQTLVRSIFQYKLMRGFRETWKRWKSGKTVHYDTLQDPLYMCLESAHKTLERGLECTQQRQHCKFGGHSGQRNSCEKKHIQRMNGRFVRQFLEDLDDCPRFVHKAEEGDRAVEDACKQFLTSTALV